MVVGGSWLLLFSGGGGVGGGRLRWLRFRVAGDEWSRFERIMEIVLGLSKGKKKSRFRNEEISIEEDWKYSV
jgi:hypothetical protein